MSAAFSIWWTPNGIAQMRIIALLFAFMLTGCAGGRLTAETKPMTKCETVSALLSNPSATRRQVAAAVEMGRNNRCFGT
jgi:hypothetical protein